MILLKLKWSVVSVCLLLAFCGLSQTSTTLLEKAELAYGVNDLLMNGRQYKEPHPTAKGDPFLLPKMIDGTVYIKGEIFEDVGLKYDIFSDDLLMRVTSKQAWFQYIVANEQLVDSFQIEDRKFLNAQFIDGSEKVGGYFEVLNNGKIKFYQKHFKTFNDVHDSKYPNGYFFTGFPSLFVLENGTLTKLKNKGALLKYFKNEKGPLKQFMKSSSIKYKKATNEQLKSIAQFCNETRYAE